MAPMHPILPTLLLLLPHLGFSVVLLEFKGAARLRSSTASSFFMTPKLTHSTAPSLRRSKNSVSNSGHIFSFLSLFASCLFYCLWRLNWVALLFGADKKVFPHFYILGWYSTGSDALESDMHIHKAVSYHLNCYLGTQLFTGFLRS